MEKDPVSLASRAARELVDELGERIFAVALFGSAARGEISKRSDYDFLVVVRGFGDADRRFKIYHILYRVLRGDVTLIDIDYESLFRKSLEVTPLLINIACDAKILHDPTGRLKLLLHSIKSVVEERFKRYRTRDGKYGWRPIKQGLGVIEVPYLEDQPS